LKQRLQKLECHFTWDLGYSKNELKALRGNLKDVNQERCTWLLHYYNLLGYIQQTLGFNTEALTSLHKAESVIQEQGTEEAGVRLQVNKANLAWVYFLMGEMNKSKGYLEEVESLQGKHPAPPGCALHPEVSGEKGWTLVKFNKSKKRQAIDYFKMALNAEPARKEWHKGLAIAMLKTYKIHNGSPQLNEEILKLLKIAHENEPNNLLLHALYLEKQSEVQLENNERQMQDLLEKALETGDLECLGSIFSVDLDLNPHLSEIADVLGWKTMKRVAHHSGISKTGIEEHELNHRNDVKEQTFALLQAWSQRRGLHGAYPALIKTLRHMNERRKADEIQKIIEKKTIALP
ncbi:hypothetical protein cypCar_00005714, partial [Cyprinus carpio]